MKRRGTPMKGPRTQVVPILRDESEGGNIYFTVQGVIDFAPFYAICPAPEPPKILMPGGQFKLNVEDKGYKYLNEQWWKKRTSWMFLKSIEPSFTPETGLEWETVKMDDPETYVNWDKELKDAGFNDAELTRLITAIMKVNALDENLIEEARASFLTTQGVANDKLSSQMDAAPNIPSGGVVSKLV